MSLKKLTDINNNDIQVESAIKDAKGQNIHSTYQEKLTTTSVSDGTINKVIGFDTNGDIVKGTQSGGGGTQLYLHEIEIDNGNDYYILYVKSISNVAISTFADLYTLIQNSISCYIDEGGMVSNFENIQIAANDMTINFSNGSIVVQDQYITSDTVTTL